MVWSSHIFNPTASFLSHCHQPHPTLGRLYLHLFETVLPYRWLAAFGHVVGARYSGWLNVEFTPQPTDLYNYAKPRPEMQEILRFQFCQTIFEVSYYKNTSCMAEKTCKQWYHYKTNVVLKFLRSWGHEIHCQPPKVDAVFHCPLIIHHFLKGFHPWGF